MATNESILLPMLTD